MAQFCPFILNNKEGLKIPVEITPMTQEDALSTTLPPKWQTDWTSDYVNNPKFLKFAMKIKEGELVALGAYEIQDALVAVHIAYVESHPESNPTIAGRVRKYYGIRKAMIAFGIKLSIDHDFGGDVTFEAKTSELEDHYIRDFGAIPLPKSGSSDAPRFFLFGDAAKIIFTTDFA